MQTPSAPTRELEPEFLLSAYAGGYFPMADPESGQISWYSPDPRTILELNGLRVSRSLRRSLRREDLEVRWDTAFEAVMRACGERPETWISDRIVKAYVELHRLGFAHSVEVWKDGALAGGLYGVALAGAFFGESMFSRVTDASKIALVHLVRRLVERDFLLLDVQFMTEHLRTLGAVEIPREEYLQRLRTALQRSCVMTDQPSREGKGSDVDIP
jgi:leucyl/phenylalanyl-tRNA--protein transferase